MRPGDTAKVDYEYVREGMCNAFMFVQPLGGWREVHVSKFEVWMTSGELLCYRLGAYS